MRPWVLLDSSVWISNFRGQDPGLQQQTQELISEDRVTTCGPVLFEIHRGMRPSERKAVMPLLNAIPLIPFEEEDWLAAGALDVGLRAKGITLPNLDLLIAQICLRHHVTLFALDKHFSQIPGLCLLPREGA